MQRCLRLLVFFEAFKCTSHLFRDVRLWWFCLLKDTVNSSSDSICLFGVELSYGCFDLGDDLCGRNIRTSYGEVQSFLQ